MENLVYQMFNAQISKQAAGACSQIDAWVTENDGRHAVIVSARRPILKAWP
jgi:hypothetical protein